MGSNLSRLYRKKSENKAATQTEDPDCVICLSSINKMCVVDPCMHSFCYSCLKQWRMYNPICPLCKRALSKIIYDIKGDGDYKIEQIQPMPEWENILPGLNALEIEIRNEEVEATIFNADLGSGIISRNSVHPVLGNRRPSLPALTSVFVAIFLALTISLSTFTSLLSTSTAVPTPATSLGTAGSSMSVVTSPSAQGIFNEGESDNIRSSQMTSMINARAVLNYRHAMGQNR